MRFGFFLGEAFGSMRRNWVMAMAAVITVFISTAILGGVLVTRDNLSQGATSLKNRVMIEVFIKDSAKQDAVLALEKKIQAIPEVKTYTYISKEEALARFREKFGERIVANLPVNPLPASFEIQAKDANDVDKIAKQFFDDPTVDNDPGTHNGVKYARETVRKMLGTISLIEKGMWVTTAIFAAAAVLLISTTVRLSIFARRREVEIMRLVGATNWFIRWPFVLEGFITGLVGAILASVFIYGGNWAIANWITSSDINFIDLKVYPDVVARGDLARGDAADAGRHRRAARRAGQSRGVASVPEDLRRGLQESAPHPKNIGDCHVHHAQAHHRSPPVGSRRRDAARPDGRGRPSSDQGGSPREAEGGARQDRRRQQAQREDRRPDRRARQAAHGHR